MSSSIRGFRKLGGGGGGGVTGNLRWGPNMGTVAPGVNAAISAAEYRQITTLSLTAQEAILLKGAITALLPMSSVQTLQIFYTLVFLYTLASQAAITMPATQLVGALAVQGAITGNLVAAYGAEQVVAAMRLVSLVLSGQLSAQAVLTGLAQVVYQMQVNGAVQMPVLQLNGALQAQAAITQPTVGLVGLTSVSGTVLGLYVLAYPTALGSVGTLGLTYVMNWQSAGTFSLAAPVTANYKLESWAGGGGAGAGGAIGAGGGGAGGSFSRTNALSISSGSTITVRVAATVAAGTIGNDSFISTTGAFPASTATGVGAKGGALGAAGSTSAGAGGVGSTTGCIGDTKFAGGNGTNGGVGGGGAGDANAGVLQTGGAVGGGNGGAAGAAGAAAGGGGGGGSVPLGAGGGGAIGRCRLTVVAA